MHLCVLAKLTIGDLLCVYFFKLHGFLDLSFKLEYFVSDNTIREKIIKYDFDNIVLLHEDVKTLILTINFSNVVGHI